MSKQQSLRTNIAFNESEVLRAFKVSVTSDGCTPIALQMFYNDEHAMTLGVRQTQVKTCAGTTVTGNFPIAAAPAITPTCAINPQVGATEQQGGVDPSLRPMFPALFITDLDVPPGNTNPLAGDWQYGGTGIPPDAVFGMWKAAVTVLDRTVTPNTYTVTPDADPPVNNWNLGLCSPPDPVPTPTPTNQGYGAECRWNISSLNLIPGHHYRLYFIVHDGDQNHSGGDSGQDCIFLNMPGTAPTPTPTATASPTPTATPTATVGDVLRRWQDVHEKKVTVVVSNFTGASQLLTGLSITWPQVNNGNLKSITFNGTTIYNTSTGAARLTRVRCSARRPSGRWPRAHAEPWCLTSTNNVSTNASNYTGSLTFNPFGAVTILP